MKPARWKLTETLTYSYAHRHVNESQNLSFSNSITSLKVTNSRKYTIVRYIVILLSYSQCFFFAITGIVSVLTNRDPLEVSHSGLTEMPVLKLGTPETKFVRVAIR